MISYSVDAALIDKRFEEMRNNKIEWTLIGNNRFFLKEGVHSCASIVMLLLNEAGLDTLLKNNGKDLMSFIRGNFSVIKHRLIQNHIIVTPNNVKTVLEHASKIENNLNKENDLERR